MSAYLSARESAAYCGVSEKTIRNWIAAGRLSAEKSAGAFRIAQEDLDTLRNGSPHPPQAAESASAEVRADDGPQGAEGSAEAGHLADLVRDLTRQLAEQTGLTMVWMERARVLSDQLALAAPAESPVAGQQTALPPDPPRGEPLTARLRVLAPWVVVVLTIGVVILLLVWPR
jgi:excisionase family DNA binding protein